MSRYVAAISVPAAILLLAGGAAILATAGCERDRAAPAATQPAGEVVNAKCPVMGTAIDPAKVPPELIREHKGRNVGFCCAGCPAAWDKLSDAEKDAKLEAAITK